MKTILVGSDFSGVGAFDFAIGRVANAKGFKVKTVFACDMDKFARQTYIHNHGEPDYYPANVYDREIPAESIDVYMTSPPCQAFSMAGKRLGKDDKRGILFFNSHEFIQKNNPRFFIFENVRGLISHDNGKTFSEWLNLLAGKSVNGLPVLFPYENAVNYHVYWQVLNAKNHGVPQNRERVFIIGIRDDRDNNFRFPIEEHLTKRLIDVLEKNVDEKYFLSEKIIKSITKYNNEIETSINQDICTGIDASYYKGFGVRQGKCRQVIKVKSATSSGYELAELGDSINFQNTESKTRRDRVGKQVAQTIDTNCQQGILIGDYRTDEGLRWRKDNVSPSILAMMRDTWSETFAGQNPPIISYNEQQKNEPNVEQLKQCGVVAFGRSEQEKKRRKEHYKKTKKDSGSFKDKDLIIKNQDYYDTLLANPNPKKEGLLYDRYKIRRLTPRECFRLMDFPDTFTWPVSDSQAYKQAGNSIVVRVLEKIITNLHL